MSNLKYKTPNGYETIPMVIPGNLAGLESTYAGDAPFVPSFDPETESVRVTPQTLTEAQKAQARHNIGAAQGAGQITDAASIGFGVGTCATSSGTALEATLQDYELVQNGFVAVTFANDVPAGATLNINSQGAKPIFNKGAAIEADTIKADDTVMFAYDGTNYVVTSLGGGTIVWPEFITIQLTQTGGNDSDLIGATVVVTNDDTSATILSTTWQGSDIAVQVDAGVDYTVTVGDVSNLDIRQHTQSYTSESGLSRIIEFSYLGIVVDMGLPSGTKWAKGNIVSNGNGTYKIGEETDYGAYVSWGNVTPHFSTNGSTFDDGYDFGDNNTDVYASTPGASITSSSYPNTGAVYTPNSGYDAARELLGGSWRIPTTTEFKELNDNCTSEWVIKNDVAGKEFTSNINGAKIFLPAGGRGRGTGIANRCSNGYYTSSSLNTADNEYLLYFGSGSNTPQHIDQRCRGFLVRAVL